MKYSIIIPVFNEEKSVFELHNRLKKVMDSFNEAYEIIFIDDGSSDKTYETVLKLSPSKIIKFRKNFGQTAALDAGIKEAKGDLIISLDGDLQNPPEEIPKLLSKLKEGYDVVSGWRWPRHDSLSKKITSRVANVLRKFFINDGIHDSGCTLKVYKKECFNQLELHSEQHRFIPGILKWQGFKITEIKVAHAARAHGESKYGYERVLRSIIDMISIWWWRKHSQRPLHLFGGGGFAMFFSGALLFFILFILRLFYNISLSDKIWPIVAIFLMLAGIQLFVSGLLAEILIRNYFSNNRRPYSIEKIEER
jgi:glycosyltransferase involved in cell wall biosynthesis